MPKDNIYIKHDYNSSNDPKVKNMRLTYGWAGFGWYWHILEIMRCETDYKLEYSDLTFGSLAEDFKCKQEEVKKYIDHCISISKLFNKNGTHFFSDRLLRDMHKLEQIREQNKEAGKKSGISRKTAKERASNTRSTSDEHKINDSSPNPNNEIDYEQTEQPFNGRLADVELVVVVDKVIVVYKENKERVVEVDNKTATTIFKQFEENINKLTPNIKISLVLDIAQYGFERVEEAIEVSGNRGKDNFAYVHKTLVGMISDKTKKQVSDNKKSKHDDMVKR
jgi:hypothetical protein